MPEPMEVSPSLLRLVAIEAGSLARSLPRGAVPFDDLEGYGRLGLVEAQHRFDPRFGVTFETFARHRIRGAIFDGLRETGKLRRRHYRRIKQDALAHELLGEPQGPPAAGPSRADDAQTVLSAITDLATLYLAEGVFIGEGPTDPDEALGDAQDRQRLRDAFQRLSGEDRAVLQSLYADEESGAEIGRQLGVSRSSIARRHQRALQRLKVLMTAPPPPATPATPGPSAPSGSPEPPGPQEAPASPGPSSAHQRRPP